VKWKSIIETGSSLITKRKTDTSSKEDKTYIEFDRENMIRCLCSQCPVQKVSECAQNKMKMLQISMKGMSPEHEDFPGMYCTNGKAVCEDIDTNKKCNCINCEVWKEYKLDSKEPGIYFCKNGKAK